MIWWVKETQLEFLKTFSVEFSNPLSFTRWKFKESFPEGKFGLLAAKSLANNEFYNKTWLEIMICRAKLQVEGQTTMASTIPALVLNPWWFPTLEFKISCEFIVEKAKFSWNWCFHALKLWSKGLFVISTKFDAWIDPWKFEQGPGKQTFALFSKKPLEIKNQWSPAQNFECSRFSRSGRFQKHAGRLKTKLFGDGRPKFIWSVENHMCWKLPLCWLGRP